ncbi:DUF4129 domain-containing protein [Natronolimnobius sp. AArcel1]|uniref:DUF4129 domain-containing protein n=1 Tax=Natronolimnobius sp. AArcel1 TaxID=1679093 RepID=UPI0013EA85AD|nr:DUF4129 domain-containing protein [Natronolimnobius sp. AArcel1]NGM70338.1 DUF4129 domain-containing protein [Natronolimnobius sp. AArcel1]
MNVDWVRIIALVGLGCVVAVAIVGGSAYACSGLAAGAPVSLTDATATNDSKPTFHIDPDTYADDSDYEDLRALLIADLADRLERSSAALAAGDTADARTPLEEPYSERVSQYETVVEETGDVGERTDANKNEGDSDRHGYEIAAELEAGNTDPEEVVTAFEQARVDQLALIEAVEDYAETESQYERAADAGDDADALEHARALDTLAADATNATDRLAGHVSMIDTLEGVDASDTSDRLERTTHSMQDRQDEIREAMFVPTTLTATAEGDTVSPTETVTITGTLETESDLPTETESTDESALEINGEHHSVPIEDGAFTVTYQPEPLAPAVDTVAVQYHPKPGTPHQSAETTVPLAIDTAPATLSLEAETDGARDAEALSGVDHDSGVAYGEPIAVSGSLAVADIPVDDAPVTLSINDTTLGTVDTDDGSFETQVVVPASVSPGEQELTATVDGTDRALESVAASQSITVRESETALSGEAVRTDAGELAITGMMTTIDGTPVADQPVHVELEGEAVETIRTDGDGHFEETLSPTNEVAVDQSVTVSYDTATTNLNATAVTMPVTDGELQTLFAGGGWWGVGLIIVAFFAILASVGGCLWYSSPGVRQRVRSSAGIDTNPGPVHPRAGMSTSSNSPAGDDAGTSHSSGQPASKMLDTSESESATVTAAHSDDFLERAEFHLSSGQTNEAVELAYAGARLALSVTVGDDVDRSRTHWEFYERYPGPQPADLESLTTTYERAAFGPETVSVDDAEDALLTAQALCTFVDDDDPVDLEALDGIVIET